MKIKMTKISLEISQSAWCSVITNGRKQQTNETTKDKEKEQITKATKTLYKTFNVANEFYVLLK